MTRFVLFTAEQAKQLRIATAADSQALDPRPIEQGPYAGKSAELGDRVLDNPDFADVASLLAQGEVVESDYADLWPDDGSD